MLHELKAREYWRNVENKYRLKDYHVKTLFYYVDKSGCLTTNLCFFLALLTVKIGKRALTN